MKRIIRLTESDLTRIVRRVIMEEEKSRILGLHKTATSKHYLSEEGVDPNAPNSYNTRFSFTQVSGPYGKPPIQYYIYVKRGKYYIFQTNATQTTPKLMDGTDWDNSGKGYDTKDSAMSIINQEINTENEPQDIDN
jgi:hypothetical protein